MSFSNPIVNLIVNPTSQTHYCFTKKEKQLSVLSAQVQKLRITTFYNRDKRVFVKAFKQQFPDLSIKSICNIVGIKVSTYYYKPRRPYFQGYVHERIPCPIQFSQFRQALKKYNLDMLDNPCKRAIAKMFVSKYPSLTTRKICQMLRLNVPTFYKKNY